MNAKGKNLGENVEAEKLKNEMKDADEGGEEAEEGS
jgi:hypothetical protein